MAHRVPFIVQKSPPFNYKIYTKVDSQKAVEAVLEGIKDALKKGEEVRLIGFGTFTITKSAARDGRNPRTGETIKIKASNRPVFRAGKELKETVNKA